ncbi:MAG: hypothetical protein ABI877_15240, partial [Gemmatimonadaceae bacterium]
MAVLLLSGPAIASAQVSATDASRLMVGDAAIEIRTAEDGQLRVAVADSEKVLVLSVLSRDAKRWADSVALVLGARSASKRAPKEWTVILEEPGLQAGSLILTRRDNEAGTRWSLFVTDREFEEIRIGVAVGEVRALVAALRRRLNAAIAPSTKRPRKAPLREDFDARMGTRSSHAPETIVSNTIQRCSVVGTLR